MSGTKASQTSQGLGPESPFDEAARLVLRRRLSAVADAVERLSESRDVYAVEPDDIHQVRVSVRRASAAISVFAPSIKSERRLARLRKRMKKLRRAIGTARACDVGLGLLSHDRKSSGDEQARLFLRLERVLSKRRAKSLDRVSDALERYSPERLKRWCKRLTASLVVLPDTRDPARALTLGGAARASLGALLAEIRSLGDADLTQAAALHELRLSAKRLRYATEVFGPCFEPDRLDEAARVLVRMQDRLGAANDLAEIVALIDERAAREDAAEEFASIRAMYADRFEACRAEFVPWWRSTAQRELLSAYRGLVGPVGPGDEADFLAPHALSGAPITPISPGVNGSKA